MNILFLTPHLSTGGMPEFLRLRIESLKDNNNIFVIEYNFYSDQFIVQREKIKTLLGENLINISGLTNTEKLFIIKNTLVNENIDIIHIEDNPETFDGTKIPLDILSFIYKNDRKWRVVETTHNIWFNQRIKTINPDGYAFCTQYHIKNNFNQSNIPYSLIEYPILDKITSNTNNPFDPTKINILSVGLWSSGKNHGNTIELARRYLEINPNVVFNIVGNFAENFRDYWGDIIPNIPENCVIWGERNDVEDFYQNCDLFLFNSTYECSPISIKDAISYNNKLMIRNLDAYMNKYKDISYNITSNIEEDIKTLTLALEKENIYDYQYDTINSFSNKHIDFYKSLLEVEPTQNVYDSYIPKVIVTYNTVIKCEIIGGGNYDYDYNVSFYDNDTNKLVYNTSIKSNHWTSPLLQYYVKWRVEVTSNNPLFNDFVEIMDLNNKKVCIIYDSSSLGDTLAWFPYVEKFAIKNNCKVNLKTYKNFLFNDSENVKLCNFNNYEECYATYNIGVYNDINKNPNKWNDIPLGQVCSDILGVDYIEERPILNKDFYSNDIRPIEDKYVVIATNSTSQLKFWNNEGGWEEVITWLKSNGYRVFNSSQENNIFVEGLESLEDFSIENTAYWIRHSEFFIGLSSGISWLAWSLNKYTFIIAGFIDEVCEFLTGMTRIKNINTCSNCWNTHEFDKGNWNWCPIHENTERQFECSKKITSKMVIDKLKSDYIEMSEYKLKAVHILVDIESDREIKSIKSMCQISNEIEYIQCINEKYIGDIWRDKQPLGGWLNHGQGHWGAFTSFKRGIIENFSEDLDGLLIFEADCVLDVASKEFIKMVNKALDFCKRNDISLFSFGDRFLNGHLQSPEIGSDPLYDDFLITNNLVLAHCILITKYARNYILDNLNTSWDSPDIWFSHILKMNNDYSKIGIIKNPIAYQEEGVSMIDNYWTETKSKTTLSDDSITVVLAHADTEFRKNLLKNCVSKLKGDILLSCNYPADNDVQEMCDYTLYTKKNPLLYKEEYSKYNMNHSYYYTVNNELIYKTFDFEHSYAVYTLIKSAIDYCRLLNKKKIHFINYDYEIENNIFLNNDRLLNEYDMVFYKTEEKTYSTGLFSGKIDTLDLYFSKYKSKEEYYTEEFTILEKKVYNFYNTYNIKELNMNDLRLNNKIDIEGVLYFSKSESKSKRTFKEIGTSLDSDKIVFHEYDKIYVDFLEKYRNKNVCLFEIGLDEGKSVKLWKEYFTNPKIYGMDLDKKFSSTDIEVFQGDQSKMDQVIEIANKVPKCDFILDDGSHIAEHQLNCFYYLFVNLLKPGGVYIIEDIECSYWDPNRKLYGYDTGHLNIVDHFTKLNHQVNTKHNSTNNELGILSITYGPNCIVIKKIE